VDEYFLDETNLTGKTVSNSDVSDSEIIAAIDLGSNSFHMIVAREVEGELQIRDRLRETVRLAAGMHENGRLDKAAKQRALDCLRRFGQRLADFSPGTVRAVGTNTLRKAKSPTFLREAEAALGHRIEVISGLEEARMIYLGVSHGLPFSDETRLIVDIGGGSTELILGRRFEPLELESLYMGCVSFSQRFFAKGRISAKGMRDAVIAARLELQVIEAHYRGISWNEAVGASGTVKSVGEVVRAMGWCDDGITLEALQQLVQELVSAGHVDKLQLNGLSEDRLPVVAGGVAVLLAVFEALGIERMQVSDWALREGLLYDLLGRRRYEDVRERTIVALSERYRIDVAHAARVEATAKRILPMVAKAWSLEGEEMEHLLLWASRLHEIGLAIAHSSYHKHGAYLIANSDMAGFSSNEQRMLAILIRAHRRKMVEPMFGELPGAQRQSLRRLTILLRIAVLLHRSHSEVTPPAMDFSARGKTLQLQFPSGWLAEHPLTEADLLQEALYQKSIGYTLKFH
jgi:exopolyphosphatase / guanosine-5'-triphosphate,3'-diphosphate pyrophosphatase